MGILILLLGGVFPMNFDKRSNLYIVIEGVSKKRTFFFLFTKPRLSQFRALLFFFIFHDHVYQIVCIKQSKSFL